MLQDIDSYEDQRRALLLLKFLAQGDRELKQGQGIPHKRAARHFEESLAGLKDG